MANEKRRLTKSIFIGLCLFTVGNICYGRASSPAYLDRTQVRDMSGNGNTATNHGVDLFETSAGWVLESDLNTYADTGLISTSNGAMVVDAEFYNESVFVMFCGAQNGAAAGYLRAYFGVRFGYIVGGLGEWYYAQITTPGTFTVGERYHMCLSYGSTNVSIYVNGRRESAVARKGGVSNLPMYLGNYNYDGVTGKGGYTRIYSVSLYTQELSEVEVTNLYDGVEIAATAAYQMQPEFR